MFFRMIPFFFALLFTASTVFAFKPSSIDVVAIAAQIMNVEASKIKPKKKLNGGTRARNNIFELNGKEYIIKVFSPGQSEESRKNEIAALKIFSELGLGAKFIASSKDGNAYVREHLEGRTAKYEDFQNTDTLKKLALSIKKIHDYKYDKKARSQMERAEKHYARITRKNVATPSDFEESYEAYKKQYAALKDEQGFCHNDLNPHNIIIAANGQICFIDLAKSGNANKFEELGFVTLTNGITGKNLEIFLEAYFGRIATQDEINSVKLAQKLTSFLTSLVWFDFSESKKDKDIKLEDRRKTLDKMLKSEDLKSASEFIKENTYVSVKSRKKDMVKQYAVSFYKNYLEM